jgi:ribulose-phosphate 3-epimerase
MSVNPGFGGQGFIPSTLDKLRALSNMRQQLAPQLLIEVDGGVTLDNAASIVAAGADVLVAGSTVFQAANPIETIAALKRIG